MPVHLPDSLVGAVRDHKCILFLGSGLSAMAGYPNWSRLIDRLVTEARRRPNARLEGLEAIEARQDYFMLAEFARATLGSAEYVRLLKKELARPVPATDAHRLIAATDYRGVITTNYDRLLETTVTQVRSWTPSTFTHDNLSAMAEALFSPELFIFKMHGDILSPGSVVLTVRDYDHMLLRSPHVRALLFAVFLNYKLLFVGYSLRDPDFNLILRELTLLFENYVPTHYALVPQPCGFETDHLQQLHDTAPVPLPVAA